MPSISVVQDYNGFANKTARLGLDSLVNEALSTITRFPLLVEEKRFANGTKGIRQTIDDGFDSIGGWVKVTVGGVDWTKKGPQGATVGVEVQVSGRSDMLAVDIMHLRERLVEGDIDIGIIIVPDDELSRYLTDRTPNFATAKRHVEHRAKDLPIRIVAFHHDGAGPPLSKMLTNLSKRNRRKP